MVPQYCLILPVIVCDCGVSHLPYPATLSEFSHVIFFIAESSLIARFATEIGSLVWSNIYNAPSVTQEQ